ncbi:MAG: Fpg/Nei family DNA glycosylase [Acidobacteriota bacterium]|nr:MAG: Fpg/Nei family DNA glycosylase [Acidobacteriota bacterium]
MPEGDTIYRTAKTLRAVLEGRELVRASSARTDLASRIAALAGRSIVSVESRGKNLLIHFDDETVLYTHMKMTGSWHVYRPGEVWRKPRRRACCVLETDAFVAVCFSAPMVELLTPWQVKAHPALRPLGPDLLAPEPDIDEILTRLEAADELSIGEGLMTQKLLAGIGNVYKSETLFLCRVDPFAVIASLDDSQREQLVRTARALMMANLDSGPRRTRFELSDRGRKQRHWVYGRRGRPCRRCGTRIQMRRQGLAGRSTYFCPRCQSVGRYSCADRHAFARMLRDPARHLRGKR